MTAQEERTVRHSSGLTAVLTEEEYQRATQELPAGTLVYLGDYGDGQHTARVVEQSPDRRLTWVDVKTATCAMSGPACATIKLRRAE